MTGPTPGRRVTIDADLQLSIDGVEATLVGRRGELTLRTDEPARLARALRRSGFLRALRRMDQRLTVAGLQAPTLMVEGPRGRVARLAPRTDGDARRAAPGGTTVRWYRPQDLVPTPRRRVLLGVVTAAVIILVWRRRNAGAAT